MSKQKKKQTKNKQLTFVARDRLAREVARADVAVQHRGLRRVGAVPAGRAAQRIGARGPPLGVVERREAALVLRVARCARREELCERAVAAVLHGSVERRAALRVALLERLRRRLQEAVDRRAEGTADRRGHVERGASERVDGKRSIRRAHCGWELHNLRNGLERERGVRRDSTHRERHIEERRPFALLGGVRSECEQRAQAPHLAAEDGDVDRRAPMHVVDVDVHQRPLVPLFDVLGRRRRTSCCRSRLRVRLRCHDALDLRHIALLRRVVQLERGLDVHLVVVVQPIVVVVLNIIAILLRKVHVHQVRER
jgi:hypothetical protein